MTWRCESAEARTRPAPLLRHKASPILSKINPLNFSGDDGLEPPLGAKVVRDLTAQRQALGDSMSVPRGITHRLLLRLRFAPLKSTSS
jgi:hypothetical protein